MTSATPELHDRVLDLAARWRLARIKAQLTWAENDAATSFHTKSQEGASNPGAIKEMQRYQEMLAFSEPTSVQGAVEALNVVLEILAHRAIYPDQDTLSDGPILEILRGVRDAIEFVDGDTPCRPL
ncbi:MAG: hypothetical protein GEV13_10740 [Rhodospirillales bacterium]|nr:hypothetical protein [Rhodospirillales bacterium]